MNKLPTCLRGLMIFSLMMLFSGLTSAQCSFTPTIAVTPIDADGIYCPGDVLTLSTQAFDSYQMVL